MSLKVYAYRRAHPDAELEYLPPRPPANESAGTEGARRFWSHRALLSRGLRVIPFLGEGDVFAEGAELDELERELRIIRRDLVAIMHETGQDSDWLEFRLENIESALKSARDVTDGIGGVYIG